MQSIKQIGQSSLWQCSGELQLTVPDCTHICTTLFQTVEKSRLSPLFVPIGDVTSAALHNSAPMILAGTALLCCLGTAIDADVDGAA